METLSALLLREYCRQEEISHKHQQKHHEGKRRSQSCIICLMA
jgi:hypothetical protein